LYRHPLFACRVRELQVSRKSEKLRLARLQLYNEQRRKNSGRWTPNCGFAFEIAVRLLVFVRAPAMMMSHLMSCVVQLLCSASAQIVQTRRIIRHAPRDLVRKKKSVDALRKKHMSLCFLRGSPPKAAGLWGEGAPN
jgi:hypothetical protein